MKKFVRLLTTMAILILIYTAICFYLTGNTKHYDIPEFCPTANSEQEMLLNTWKTTAKYTVFDYERGDK